MTIQQQRTPLNGFHERKPRTTNPTRPTTRTTLPRPDELEGTSPELAEALARWHVLIDAERQQYRDAAAANAKADEATADYRAKVREALTAGDDPAKVKDQTERHKATAAAHLRFAEDAHNERERLAGAIGALLEAEAPAMFDPAEKRIETAAASVRGSLAAIREAWAGYSHAFNTRVWLSNIDVKGGSVPAFHGSTALPPAVADALATLDDHITSLDKLKADEAQVREYRANEAQAEASGRRLSGTSA
jgi:hypothetical protein